MGESYAGIYVPYFAAALLESNDSLTLHLRSMSLGDGSWGNAAAMSSVTMGAYIHSQAHLLKLPKSILSVFTAADRKCGFDDVLDQASTYPSKGKIHIPGNPENFNYKFQRRDMTPVLEAECDIQPSNSAEVNASIFNSTCYGPCATFSTALDYMATVSDAGTGPPCFDIYDIHHNCSAISPLPLLATYFSRNDVQSALHVKNSGSYSACNSTILNTLLAAQSPTPPEYSILPKLITAHNVSLHIYSGEWDMLINHVGTELSIQNMTWNGKQGFERKPSKSFLADDAAPDSAKKMSHSPAPAGIWAAERGVSYHLFREAGHSVFANKPREMFAFVRDVVVGGKVG